MKCVIADSSVTMRRILTNALRTLGCDQILETRDAGEALALCEQNPDLVILNSKIGGMTGIELVRKIREKPEFAQTRLLLVTDCNTKEHVLEAVQAGVNACVLKPFTLDTLRIKIGRLLQLETSEVAGTGER